MGFEDEDRKEAERARSRLEALTQELDAAIKRKGIARVFAEFIEQNNQHHLHYRDRG
jgi:hypothetical protein